MTALDVKFDFSMVGWSTPQQATSMVGMEGVCYTRPVAHDQWLGRNAPDSLAAHSHIMVLTGTDACKEDVRGDRPVLVHILICGITHPSMHPLTQQPLAPILCLLAHSHSFMRLTAVWLHNVSIQSIQFVRRCIH